VVGVGVVGVGGRVVLVRLGVLFVLVVGAGVVGIVTAGFGVHVGTEVPVGLQAGTGELYEGLTALDAHLHVGGGALGNGGLVVGDGPGLLLGRKEGRHGHAGRGRRLRARLVLLRGGRIVTG